MVAFRVRGFEKVYRCLNLNVETGGKIMTLRALILSTDPLVQGKIKLLIHYLITKVMQGSSFVNFAAFKCNTVDTKLFCLKPQEIQQIAFELWSFS